MKTEQSAAKVLFFVAIICLFLTSSGNASPGVKFWFMNVGNHWVYDGSDSGGATWTVRDEVVGIDSTTVPGVTTYKVEGRMNGLPVVYQWFSASLAELTEWREMGMGDIGFGKEWITLAYDSGLVFAKNPIIVGDHWVTQTTATLIGETGWSYPFDISLDMTIQAQEFITVPLGVYKAYKLQQILHFWNDDLGIDQTETQYVWFVPYLGQVKSQDTLGNVVSLASLSVKKGIIDFDSDGKTDIAIYRASNGAWYIHPSAGSPPYGVGWGGDSSDIPVAGDYDGDGKSDIAFYRGNTGVWWITPSSGIPAYGVGWGGSAFKPVPGDYDGDGKTDIAIYDTTAGAWWAIPSSGSPAYGVGWGGSAFSPVPGDYDGDGKTDIAIYDSITGAWWIIPSSGTGAYGVGWGGSGFTPVPGDYDGDGKADVAIYQEAAGSWWIIPSSSVTPGTPSGVPYGVGWGGPGFKLVPGDYDADGKTDVAIYEISTGIWWIIPSSGTGTYGVGWGGDASDIPLTANFPSIY